MAWSIAVLALDSQSGTGGPLAHAPINAVTANNASPCFVEASPSGRAQMASVD
jgi:hypothetical protein